MIIIHWDFTDGTEVSYIQGKMLKDNFTTNCLDFFTSDNEVDDVVVITKDGNKISRNELLNDSTKYTSKNIRKEHNLHKMLVAGAFEFI